VGAHKQLRSPVLFGASINSILPIRCSKFLSEPEICDFDDSSPTNKNIVWFHISMKYIVVVQIGQSLYNLPSYFYLISKYILTSTLKSSYQIYEL